MKRAVAIRTGPTSYRVTFAKQKRDCPYRFLLALMQAGYRVTIRQDGWGKSLRKT